jgi:hypothetical protein
MNGISLSELARWIGRDKGLLSRKAKSRPVLKQPDGSFEEAAVRRALKRSLVPARPEQLTGVNC